MATFLPFATLYFIASCQFCDYNELSYLKSKASKMKQQQQQ